MLFHSYRGDFPMIIMFTLLMNDTLHIITVVEHPRDKLVLVITCVIAVINSCSTLQVSVFFFFHT